MKTDAGAQRKVALPLHTCERCGHTWFGRIPMSPKKCPHCGSVAWARPRAKRRVTR